MYRKRFAESRPVLNELDTGGFASQREERAAQKYCADAMRNLRKQRKEQKGREHQCVGSGGKRHGQDVQS